MSDTDTDEPIIPWPEPAGTTSPELHLDAGLLHGAILRVEERVIVLLDAEPSDQRTHDLALTIDRLDALGSKLKEIAAEVQEAFCRSLPFGTTSVGYPDCAALIPRWGGSRIQWDSKALRDDVHSSIMRMIHEGGEGGAEAEEVFDALEKVVSITGSNVKTTGLKKLGLDPDDYSEKVPKAPSVQVMR